MTNMTNTPGQPRRPVIDGNAVRFLIGASALLLPVIEIILAIPRVLESISASYATDPWPRNLFVGFNFAIGTFMLTYNGKEKWESRLAKFGAVAAYVVALVPGKYQGGKFLISSLPADTHVAATAVLFAVLIGFCLIFRRRARRKLQQDPGNVLLKRRFHLYAGFAAAMGLSVVLFAAHVWLERSDPSRPDPFYLLLAGEVVGLFAFGLSWLTASKFIFAADPERLHLYVTRRGNQGKEVDFLSSA